MSMGCLSLTSTHQCNKMSCTYCHTLSCYVCRSIIRGYEHFDQSVRFPYPFHDRFLTFDTNSDLMMPAAWEAVRRSVLYGTLQKTDTPRRYRFLGSDNSET